MRFTCGLKVLSLNPLGHTPAPSGLAVLRFFGATEMEVIISRGHDGKQPLSAKTKIDLGFDRRALVIRTSRSNGGLAAEAFVVQDSECGRFETRAYGRGRLGDFSKRLCVREGARATEKAVRSLHDLALVEVDQLKAQAVAYYGQGVDGAEPALQ